MITRIVGLAAFLTLALTAAAEAKCACDCCPAPSHKVVKAPVHRAPVRRAPAHVVREDRSADLYAQSYYDYESSSSVSESFESHIAVTPRAPWVVAQDDADIRFHYVVPQRRVVEEDYYYEGPAHGHYGREEAGLVMGGREFTGGVGYGAAGAYAGAYAGASAYAGAGAYAGGGAFVDGYGNAHFGGGMRGGVSARGAVGVTGRARLDAWHGYNWTAGIGNGY